MKFTQDNLRKSLLLYAVTDRSWLKDGQSLYEVTKSLLEGGVSFVQIREKELDLASFEHSACELQKLCREYRVPFVVNDELELALKIGADGVHLGQTDIRGRDVRSLIGKDKILGISVRTLEEAYAAEQAGADYVGVGAVFSTDTKKDAKLIDFACLQEICTSLSIPVVAIGGINSSNIEQLKNCKLAGVAVVSALFAAPDPLGAAQNLREICQQLWSNGKGA